MIVGIIGSGNIGSNIGRRAAEAGYDVVFSFAREPHRVDALASDVGHGAKSGTPHDAAQADIVVLATPWSQIDSALELAGPLGGRIVVDTTNPYGADGLVPLEGGEPTGFTMQGAFVARS